MADNNVVQAAAAPAAAAVQGQDGAGQQPAPQTTWSIISGMISRMVFMYLIVTWMKGGAKSGQEAGQKLQAPPATNMFSYGDNFAMWVFVNEQPNFMKDFPVKDLFWNLDDLSYGDWTSGDYKDGSYTVEKVLELSENLKNNGSMYMHTFITKAGHVPFPGMVGGSYDEYTTVYRSKQLNKFRKRTVKKTTNLITGETKTDKALLEHVEKHGNVEILSHWHPNLTVNLLTDQTKWARGAVPPPFDQLIEFDKSGMLYEPIVYINDYWNLLRDYTPINSTISNVTLRLTFQPISMFKLQMYASQQMQKQWSLSSIIGEVEEQDDQSQDAMKEAILETNPYMLGLTATISIVHSIFECLAFKNDIQFWKTRDTLEGLSVNSVLSGIVQSIIVLVYVMDNDTNFMIVLTLTIGCLIDVWKITKVVDIKVDYQKRILFVIPNITFKSKSSYAESPTKKYDEMAFKYLGCILFPLLVCYAIYSIMYEEHKGVYSFVVALLYGYTLTFGFIMMTPQLFINYKMKSVAHLPWRMLTYKALNTFIDDIFAFVIKMPTLYRIGCFRDDVVFFIYVYQRYAYRVDPKRYNEFGSNGERVDPLEDQPPTLEDLVAAAAGDSSLVEVPDKKND